MNRNQTTITRRSFSAGLAVASALRGQNAPHRNTAGPSTKDATHPHWYERIRRLGQLNINEKDAGLDVDHWIRYWSSLKVDGLIVSAGGIMAFYPTEVPYHKKSRFMGTRDVYGEYAAATRKAGMRVIARLDPTHAFPDLFEAHPDWFQRDRAGKVVRHREAKELYATCPFGRYYDQQMTAIIAELNTRYDPDGYYTNAWPGTGLGTICYCDLCRTTYRQRFNAEVPASNDRSDVNFRRWTDWRLERVLEVWNLWQNTATQGPGRSGIRGQPRGQYPGRSERQEDRGDLQMDERRSSGPDGHDPDVGLRAAGASLIQRHARPHRDECHQRVQHERCYLAAYQQSPSGNADVARTDGGERHDAMANLAGR